MSTNPAPTGYLTVSGLAVSCALFAGAGYLVAGWTGAACGAALLTALGARQVWLAARGRASRSPPAPASGSAERSPLHGTPPASEAKP